MVAFRVVATLWRMTSDVPISPFNASRRPSVGRDTRSRGWGLVAAGLLLGLALAATLVGLGTLLDDNTEAVVVVDGPPPASRGVATVLDVAADVPTFIPVDDVAVDDVFLDESGFIVPAPSIADIVDTLRPSVVQVMVQRTVDDGQRLLSVNGGSGVVISADGHTITNHHVVENANEFAVLTADGIRLEAELVGFDALTDIAVLKVDPVPQFGSDRRRQEFHPATFGTTVGLRQGETAIAIGYPSSIEGESTVSVGVVSARNRALAPEDSGPLLDLLQTDAEISPGSSGGGLFDESGQLIGITTLVRRTEFGLAGLGFAVPVEIAQDSAQDIIETGEAQHGWIGIHGRTNADHEANLCGYGNAVEITAVTAGGPAADAGLEVDDLIVAVNDKHVEHMNQLVRDIRLFDPGDQVTVHVCRGGSLLSLPLTLGTRDATLT